MQPMIAMKAVVLERYDAPLKLTRMERPDPGKGEVLVRINASGVTHGSRNPDIDRGQRPDYGPPACVARPRRSRRDGWGVAKW
jgi:Zn-dependent alcohol dehydrogenase